MLVFTQTHKNVIRSAFTSFGCFQRKKNVCCNFNDVYSMPELMSQQTIMVSVASNFDTLFMQMMMRGMNQIFAETAIAKVFIVD
jgi:hypothetical protein